MLLVKTTMEILPRHILASWPLSWILETVNTPSTADTFPDKPFAHVSVEL